MSVKIQRDSERVSLSQAALRNMDQVSQPERAPIGFTNLASLKYEEDELSSHSQDNYSFTPSTHAHGNIAHDLSWSMSDGEAFDPAGMSSKPSESPEVQMLSFSLSQQLLPQSTVGPNEIMYHPSGVEFHPQHQHNQNQHHQHRHHQHHHQPMDFNDHSDMDFSQAQDFSHYSAFVDFSALDNDSGIQAADDSLSVAHSHSHTDDGHLWTSMMGSHRPSLDGLFNPVPVSPPLTEASNDFSVTSSCSQSGYPAFMANDDAMLKDITAGPSLSNHGINLGDPIFPVTPPLNEDANRRIRPSKPARRAALTSPQAPIKPQEEFFPALKKGSTEMKNPRDHPYYSLSTRSDGKYYCPYAGDKGCNHPPTTQKCAYHKYLDSHLKPYRCKVPACMDAQLQFSSNACLFRHEREAHGLHGHGDNPHLCLFEGCDRSVPGNGFPRRWNLFDHMRRVHDYTSSERSSSPEPSPVLPASASSSSSPSLASKKRDAALRKKRVLGSSGHQTMKRTRSTQSQNNPLKAAQQASAHHGQRLQNAERNYYNCRSRLLEELAKITPHDSSMHEKVNASLQELITLGLSYRHIDASQAAKLAGI